MYKTVVVSCNDELVKMYLNKKIKYHEISKNLLKFISKNVFIKFKYMSQNLSQILDLDKYVRSKVNKKCIKNMKLIHLKFYFWSFNIFFKHEFIIF